LATEGRRQQNNHRGQPRHRPRTAGRDVWLIDGDRQGTAQMAISLRAEAGHTPGIACASYPDGQMVRAQVKQQAAKFDNVVIDAGGRDSSALRTALVLSDVLLVPFSAPQLGRMGAQRHCSTGR
jgi:cellulose biosynthesis protein BcsQ